MKRISSKILLMSVICCCIVIMLVGSISAYSIVSLTQENERGVENSLRQNFDTTVKYEVQTAVSLLQDLYDRSQKGEFSSDEAKKRGADLLRNLRYNKDGYFWADTYEGVNVVLPTDTERKVEGTNRYNLQDKLGNYYMHDIIGNGMKEGGGYSSYWFCKLNESEPSPKRSYSLAFKPFGWVIGTGNYIDDIDKTVKEYKDKSEEKNKEIFSIMIAAIIISLLVAIVSSLVLSKKLTKPILSVTELINKTSKFDLIYDKSFEHLLKYKDETGIMASAIIDMRKALRNMAGGMISASNSMVNNSEQLSSTSEENVKILNQIVTTIHELAEGNNSQAEMISNANTNISNVVNAIDEINLVTTENSDIAAKSLEKILEGDNSVNIQSERMNENVAISSEVSESIQELSKMIEKVGSIVDVINSIASQTNLLALNAAIEAARAGETGKGFAVVSEEIRKLAEGSSSAAKEITQIVNKTIINSKEAVEKIEKAKQVVNAQEQALNVTKDVFVDIRLSVEDIANKTKLAAERLQEIDKLSKNISNQSHDMAAVAEESAASMEEMSATSEEQLASFEMIATASEDLAKVAEDLSKEINKFKI